jgi:hypothetical protein
LGSSEPAAAIHTNVLSEAERLARAATERDVPLRLLGGAAIRLRAKADVPSCFERSYGDIDFVTGKGGSKKVGDFFRQAGYAPNVRFNALNSKERLLFLDEANDRQIDVFVGAFRMSHEIPLEGRIEVDDLTIPLAELLLTKLQVYELNEKDVRDTLALLRDHDVADSDGDTINGARVARLCANDWGLWRTITANLDTCRSHTDRYELDGGDRERIESRASKLLERIEAADKSRAWRLRAKIGERKRWYEVPEEPRH